MQYQVSYINGHSLKYEQFVTAAESPEKAVEKLRDSFEADFDHQIIDVKELKEVDQVMTKNQDKQRELQTIHAGEIFSKLTTAERDQVIEKMYDILDKRDQGKE